MVDRAASAGWQDVSWGCAECVLCCARRQSPHRQRRSDAMADVFVLPSAYREGIPRVLLEAASMGLPIVTTDSPGCRDVVEDGVNGLLVPVRDVSSLSQAIRYLIERPDLCRRFGQLSRQRAVEQFDLSVIAEQTRSLYEELWARKTQEVVIEV